MSTNPIVSVIKYPPSATQPYIPCQAEEEIGESQDWEDARRVSLKKWQQIAAGDDKSYPRGRNCGYCYVAENRTRPCYPCQECPARDICTGASDREPAATVRLIEDLEHLEKED